MLLKQSTAKNITILMIDSADHITGKTGLAAGLTIYLSKDGGTPATITPTVTELDATNVKGVYKLALTTAHTNTLGDFQLHITATGADPYDVNHQVVAVDVEDATAFGLSRIDATISSRSTYAGGDTSGTTTLLSRIASALTITGGAVTVGTNNDKTGYTVSTNNDKTGYSLSAAGVQAIWDALTSALTTVGSVGKRIADFLTGDAYSRLGAPSGASISADIQTRLATSGYTTPPTASQISVAVVDQTLSGHTTAGTVGGALNSASAAGDPWNTAIPGAYGAGTAGNIVGNKLDALISSRATPSDVRSQVDAALDATGAELSSSPGVSGSLRQKLNWLFQYFKLKKTVTASTETLYKGDNTTVLSTATVSDDGTTFTKGAQS